MVTILAETPAADLSPAFPSAIELPAGLIGFPELKRFEVDRADGQGPFLWLRPDHSDDPATGFLMIAPDAWIEDYRLELFEEDAACLTLGAGPQPWVFNIVTLHPDAPERATVNLLGPLVVRREDGVGKQVILANHQRYSATQPLVPAADR